MPVVAGLVRRKNIRDGQDRTAVVEKLGSRNRLEMSDEGDMQDIEVWRSD